MLKRAVIIGASSGIGAALVPKLIQQGYRIAAVARRETLLQQVALEHNNGEMRVIPIVHDVTRVDTVSEAFHRAVEALGGLDLIVYAAGVMPAVEPSEWNTSKDHQILQVNVMGAIAWLNLAAERFEVQQCGTIVGIGSVAGDRGRRGQPVYCASKAALHCYLEACRNRLSQHGVRVVTIKPGPVHTPMTEGLDKLPMVIQAEQAASQICQAIHRSRTVAYVPIQWWPIMTIIRTIPSLIFRRLDI